MGVIRERIDLETEESPQLRELRDYVGVSHEDADWELQVFAAVEWEDEPDYSLLAPWRSVQI